MDLDITAGRLNRHSVTKRFDAYADVDWEAPEMVVDPRDSRWELPADDPLGATAWYRALPAGERSRLGLHVVAQQLALGVRFEAILGRGLLHFAAMQPAGSPAQRYAYHELAEEAQHSLMFLELIARAGLETRPMPLPAEWHALWIPSIARSQPELFFLYVLGGEAPVDHIQREALRRHGDRLPPVLRRIMRIHVTEEARHLCFAKALLAERVPRLGPLAKRWLRLRAPLIFADMATQMLRPPRWLTRAYGMPNEVYREAYGRHSTFEALRLDALAPVRDLCTDLELVTPTWVPLWAALGIWPDVHRAHDGTCGSLA